MTRQAHDHRADAAKVPAQVQQHAAAGLHAGHRVLELGHDRRHEHVEPDDTDTSGMTRQAL